MQRHFGKKGEILLKMVEIYYGGLRLYYDRSIYFMPDQDIYHDDRTKHYYERLRFLR